MTTAAERKARREERLQKEEKREKVLSVIWTGLRYIGALVGFVVFAVWLAVTMQENPQWWMDGSWGVASLAVGAFLFKKAGEKRNPR